MIVAVLAVLIVQMRGDQEIGVVGVRNWLVTA